MNLLTQARQAFFNIGTAKLRSALAILGILIGSAAVVALMNTSQLATDAALAQFKALGSNLMSISAFEQHKKNNHSHYDHISFENWRALPDELPDIQAIAPYITAYQPIHFQGHLLQGNIIGADEQLAAILKVTLNQGHFVSFVDQFEQYCVIGHALSEQIKQFTQDSPMGQHLVIGSHVFTIIGTANKWPENSFFNDDINHSVIIPLSTMALIGRQKEASQAILRVKTTKHLDNLMTSIKKTLNRKAPTLTIFIRSAEQIIKSMENQGHIFTLLLGVIGGIALLVGGIGIMNVMLICISERKKEIGIRKAVGATAGDIQILFLIEAILLSIGGGLVGVLIGWICTALIAYYNHWPFHIHYFAALAGFSISLFSGIFFGFYPAKRAAMLPPVVCLRS